MERHPELRPAIGYAFRPERPQQGIVHCFAVDRVAEAGAGGIDHLSLTPAGKRGLVGRR